MASNPRGVRDIKSALYSVYPSKGIDRIFADTLVTTFMRFLRAGYLAFVFVFIISLPFVLAQPEKNIRGISQRLDHIIKELDSAQKQAQELLSQQNQIIEEIKNLKVWSRR